MQCAVGAALTLPAHCCPRAALQGALPNLCKLAPAAGISWFVFEKTKMLLGVDARS